MGFLYPKCYKAIPDLQKLNKTLLLFFFAVLLFFVACTPNSKKHQAEVRTLDSLLLVLNDFDGRLWAIEPSYLDNLNEKVAQHLINTSWQNNEAALSSLNTAQKFLLSFGDHKTAILNEIALTEKSVKSLRETLFQEGDENVDALQKIKEFNIKVSQFDEQTDYLLSRFYAQELLVETLDKALKHE